MDQAVTCGESCRKAMPGHCCCSCGGDHHGEAAPVRQLRIAHDYVRHAGASSGGVVVQSADDPMVEGVAATIASMADGVEPGYANGQRADFESAEVGSTPTPGANFGSESACAGKTRSEVTTSVPPGEIAQRSYLGLGHQSVTKCAANTVETSMDEPTRAAVPAILASAVSSGHALSLPTYQPPPGVRVRPGIRHDDTPCWVATFAGSIGIGDTPQDAVKRSGA